MLGRGQVGATVEVGVIDLFAGLLGYICAILMLVTLRRTVLKGNGDGEVEIEIYVLFHVEKLETILCSSELP